MSELPELTNGDVEHDKFQGIQMLENGFASAKINILSKLQACKFLFFKTLTHYMLNDKMLICVICCKPLPLYI